MKKLKKNWRTIFNLQAFFVSNQLVMEDKKNILDVLSKGKQQGQNASERLPFCTPEGYFESLSSRLSSIPFSGTEPVETKTNSKSSVWAIIKPYVACAASLALLVTAGTSILKMTAGDANTEEMTDYQFLGYSDLIPKTATVYEMFDQEDDLSYDDITDYLIDSRISVERIVYETNY